MRELELLAPAKNIECGMAAIDCGADAVYIGASRFGARQTAGNSIEDIEKLCRYAHLFECKVYVTVNTIIYENELDDTQRLLEELANIGVDAILVQDMGVLRMNIPGGMALHASTQTDNRTEEKVRWLGKAGFSRVVLARELTLNEIRQIHEANPGIELEAFVHGALCVSYSGVCYASEHCFGRSANRGACAQFCRLRFDLLDSNNNIIEKDVYLLSLKDLCRINSIERLADAGVKSFKIEGRLKDINYVKNVTAAYNKELNELVERRPHEYKRASIGVCTPSFTPNLNKTFNRGFTEYFIDGRKSNIASFYTPKAMGEYVGKVKEIRGNSFNVSGTANFTNGDGLCFISTDKKLEGFRVNKVIGNRLFPLNFPVGLKRGTALYRNSDRQFEKELEGDTNARKLSVNISLAIEDDTLALSAQVEGRDTYVEIRRDYQPEKARSPQAENIRRQLTKLGNTLFIAHDISVIPENSQWFIPNSILSDMRHECIAELEAKIASDYKGRAKEGNDTSTPKSPEYLPGNYENGYMFNIANHLAEEYYRSCGLKEIQPAYEIKKTQMPLLMHCRYCLRYEIGQCKKQDSSHLTLKDPLRLRLGDGRTFRLEFDCKNCKMNIYAEN